MQSPHCSCVQEGSQCVRFRRWTELSRVDVLRQEGRYAKLLEAAARGDCFPPDKARELHADVTRTCPSLSFFSDSGGGRALLTDVLSAWVVFDAQEAARATGYVQGMNFIATFLLYHSGRAEAAFWVFVALMQNYGLQCMFQAPDMYGLKMRGFVVSQLVQQQMPELSVHLAEYLRNSLSLLLTEWLLTLFANSVPLGPLAEFWDVLFQEGYYAVYRLILARLRCLRHWLLAETDFMALVHLVKEAHVEFDTSGPGMPKAYLLNDSTDRLASTSRQAKPEPRSSNSHSRMWRRLMFGSGERGAAGHHPAAAGGAEMNEALGLAGCEEEYDGGAPASMPSGAWICMTCNGSESCRSWDVLVSALLRAETVTDAAIKHFEDIFSHADAPRPPSPADVAEAPAPAVTLSGLQAENQELRKENAALASRLLHVESDVALLKRQVQELMAQR